MAVRGRVGGEAAAVGPSGGGRTSGSGRSPCAGPAAATPLEDRPPGTGDLRHLELDLGDGRSVASDLAFSDGLRPGAVLLELRQNRGGQADRDLDTAPEDGDRSMRMSLLMPTKLPPTSVPAWDVGVLPEVVRLRADRSRQRDVGPSSLPSSSISRCVHGMRSRHAVVAPVPVFCSWARVPLSCWCGRRVPRFVRNATGAGAAAPRRRRGAPGYRRQRGSDARLSPSVVDHSDGDSLWQPRRAILTRHVGRPAAGTARWVSASGPVPRAVRTVWTHLLICCGS